jgi:hypothetical protein
MQKAVEFSSSLLLKGVGMATLPCNSFYTEISKLAHFHEAHILLPTFPAGQIEKNESQEPEAWVVC